MKVRTGFVSNSSSSSFIAVGFKEKDAVFPPEDNETVDDLHDELCVAGEEGIWGISIARNLEDMDIEELTSEKLDEARKEVIELCKKYNIVVDPANIKIYYGTRSC